MFKRLLLCLIIGVFISRPVFCQHFMLVPIPEIHFGNVKEFPFYSTINEFDFKGKKIAVNFFDDRSLYRLHSVGCSEVVFKNTLEFAQPFIIHLIEIYLDSIFYRSGIIINATATDTMEMRLEAIDVWTNKFVTKVHGLCQVTIKYKGINKTYCADVANSDLHAPMTDVAFSSTSTVIRFMGSAAIREVIEKFLIDLKNGI